MFTYINQSLASNPECTSSLHDCFIIIIREKVLGLSFPPKYLKCCCNSKYHLWHIGPGSKEYDLEYLIEMCYSR